ncbi:hypothetical protein SLEP1_g12257 [Rubroshorea leprosula]|uniref:Uncharacterized protein n=1 Tax=Rubroshorea leprosula TaxID=152421 RepID=A0AAV5ILE0_9ROSI|nr:hypothetical protein SLEP1_g12257 [Rubroshorea leprosula]
MLMKEVMQTRNTKTQIKISETLSVCTATLVLPLLLVVWSTNGQSFSVEARHLLDITLPQIPEHSAPELPELPRPELPELPPLPKVELPPFPEFPSIPRPELPELTNPILPTFPTIPEDIPNPKQNPSHSTSSP